MRCAVLHCAASFAVLLDPAVVCCRSYGELSSQALVHKCGFCLPANPLAQHPHSTLNSMRCGASFAALLLYLLLLSLLQLSRLPTQALVHKATCATLR